MLLSDAAGAADQTIGVRATGDYQSVARPCRQMYDKTAIAASVRPANRISKNAM
jgi:hypothetical protein